MITTTTGPTTYRVRAAEVQVLQWTGENVTEMEAFAGVVFSFDPERAMILTPWGDWTILDAGNYVVCGETGIFFVVDADTLADNYEIPTPEDQTEMNVQIKDQQDAPAPAPFDPVVEIRLWLPPHACETGHQIVETSLKWTWTTSAGTWRVDLGVPVLGRASVGFTGPGGSWRFPDIGEQAIEYLRKILVLTGGLE